MRGDELGKLHNIFIRYNFTRLVDRLQGDTLKTNAEPQGEKKKEELWLTHGCVDEGRNYQNQMNNNRRVFWSYNCD